MLQLPHGVFSAAFVALVLEGGLLASAVTVVVEVGCTSGRLVIGLNLQTCELVVHPLAHVRVIDSASGAIPVCASPELVIAEGHFRVPAAHEALSIVIDVQVRVVQQLFHDWFSLVADRRHVAAVVFPFEEVAAVVFGNRY